MEKTELWIFGYASLMWQPGFPCDEKVSAKLAGYARTFCMRSIHHRGTPEKPGLVLALDQSTGTDCIGLALKVTPGHEIATLEYLRERELISSAYLEKRLALELIDGRLVEAVAYVVDTEHVQYCSNVPLAEQAEIIATAVGGRGPNTEYLFNTAEHLQESGISDPDLFWLSARVLEITKNQSR